MNKKLIIREIKETDTNKITEMYKEYMNSEMILGIDRFEGIRNFEHLGNMDFKTWIEELEFNKKQENLPKEYSSSTTYIAINEKNEIVGVIGLRWKEVGALKTYGGMIGYSIRPSKRGKGYASEMLRLSLQEYKKKQPSKEKILITCKDFNIPSKKVIEKNGGKFENAYFNPEDQYTYLRFWVELD